MDKAKDKKMKTRYERIKNKIVLWERKLAEIKQEHMIKSIELNKYIERHPSLSFTGLMTADVKKLEKIYEYFDKKYKVNFQGGLRCDNRGMSLHFWIDDDPEYLILHLSSTSNNICFSGSTSWLIKAETLADKVKTLKQIKNDIKKIIK